MLLWEGTAGGDCLHPAIFKEARVHGGSSGWEDMSQRLHQIAGLQDALNFTVMCLIVNLNSFKHGTMACLFKLGTFVLQF